MGVKLKTCLECGWNNVAIVLGICLVSQGFRAEPPVFTIVVIVLMMFAHLGIMVWMAMRRIQENEVNHANT